MGKHTVWWDNSKYKLPERIEEDIEGIYQSLREDLFHMSDDVAEKIKAKYLKAYPFIDANKIKKW